MRHSPNKIVIVNPVWDNRDAAPDGVLERFSTLTGWANAVRAQDFKVVVVQQFDRIAHVDRDGVAYHFVAQGLAPTAATLNPSVVHINGLDRPLLVRTIRRAAPRSAAIAVQDHGGFDPLALSPVRRAWLRYGLGAADALMVATPPQADVFRASGLVPASVAIRDAMESSSVLTARERPATRNRPLSILWVGRLIAGKDPLTVLDGFARFTARHPDAQLTFVYDVTELEGDLRARLDRDRALADRVCLIGRVPHPELASYYAAADVFVSGSHREGSGYAALEAIACGVVPVLTNIPSFRWLTNDGELGALWQVGDAGSLADALERITSNPSRSLQAQSAACREAFARQWTWDAIGRRAAAIYRELSRT